MEDSFDKTTTDLIKSNFELEIGDEPMTEAQFVKALSERVAYLIEYKLEFLMSTLYRLDVLEPHINEVLSPGAPDPPHIGLAKLIVERQKLRIYTKKKYKQLPLDDEFGDLAL